MSATASSSRARFWALPAVLLGLIVGGTILIRIAGFPSFTNATFRNPFEPWLQAAFLAASAACGVGLAVRDPATQLTVTGQVTLLALAQLGTLAYMIAGGWAMSRLMLRRAPRGRTIVLGVLVLMLGLEAAGALLLFFLRHGLNGSLEDLGRSVGHAVSAFGQVGFTLESDGLAAPRYALATHLVLVPLMVVGSLGLSVVLDLAGGLFVRRTAPSAARLHPYTRAGVGVWCVLYVAGVLGLTLALNLSDIYESLGRNIEMAQPPPPEQAFTLGKLAGTLADASFLAVSSRSCGMSTRAVEALPSAALLMLMALMFLGGMPGSAAGGVGTLAISRVCLGRAASASLTRYALRSIVGLLALVLAVATGLAMSDPAAPGIRLLFEATSAVSGSGLSAGVTANLSAVGQLTLLLGMVLGRLWPLLMLQQAALDSNFTSR